MELVAEWLSDLRRNYADEPLVSDVRVGVFYAAVEISTGDVGADGAQKGRAAGGTSHERANRGSRAIRLGSLLRWKRR